MFDLDFVGPRLLDDLPMYEEYFGKIHYCEEDENCILHNGEKIPYFMTLSAAYDDAHCCRVKIQGVYYYFGD